jgi:hypothetical protein
MKASLENSGFDIAEALKVPTILRTETSLAFFADPLDTTKYKAYVKQFKKTVTYRNQEHIVLPPYVFSSYDLSLTPSGYLGPDQINLMILLPITRACMFNNGCPDDKPVKDSPYFKELTKLLVWSVGIITNEDRNRIRTHSIIHHYTQLSGSNCYLSTNDSLGGIIMAAELFLSAFHRKRLAEELFIINAGFENELHADALSCISIRSHMDNVMLKCREVFSKGHLGHSLVSQKDRLQNLGQLILRCLSGFFVLLLTIEHSYYPCVSSGIPPVSIQQE